MISGLLSGPVNLAGVAVGSDQHLKIGLVLDQGTRSRSIPPPDFAIRMQIGGS